MKITRRARLLVFWLGAATLIYVMAAAPPAWWWVR